MERQVDFTSKNCSANSNIIVSFDPKWLHHFGYPVKSANTTEWEVDKIFSQSTTRVEIEQKLNKLTNNLEFYNWGNGPERLLRRHFDIGTWMGTTDGRCKVALPRDVLEKLRSDLLLLVGLKLTDEVLGLLCLLRESWRPLFNEYNGIGNYDAALNNAEPNEMIAPGHSGSFQDYELPLTVSAYKDSYQKLMSKFKAGKEGRPKDKRFHLYWKLLFHTYPRLFRLKGIQSEKNTIVAFGVVIDGCNSYQLVKEVQQKLNEPLESKQSALAEALYDRLRKPLYKFQGAVWKNQYRNRIDDGKSNRKEHVPFHPIYDFLRKLCADSEIPICDMKLARYISNMLGVDRRSEEKLKEGNLFYFLAKHWQCRLYFQRLNVWPEILESLYLRRKHEIESSSFWNKRKKAQSGLKDLIPSQKELRQV